MKPVAKLQPVFILASNHAHPIFSISYGHAAVYCDSQQNRENVAAIYKTWRGTSDATLNTIKKVLSRDRSRDHKKRKRTRKFQTPHLPLTVKSIIFKHFKLPQHDPKISQIFSIRSLVRLKRDKIIACKFLVRNPQKLWQQTRSLQNARTQYTRLALLLKTKTR